MCTYKCIKYYTYVYKMYPTTNEPNIVNRLYSIIVEAAVVVT